MNPHQKNDISLRSVDVLMNENRVGDLNNPSTSAVKDADAKESDIPNTDVSDSLYLKKPYPSTIGCLISITQYKLMFNEYYYFPEQN